MTLSRADLKHLAERAIVAARNAGEFIAKSRPASIQHKQAGESLSSQVVTEIDQQSQDIILHELLPTCAPFELALLTEESADDGSRFEKDYFWCIDPLDGTLPFIESTPGYSVSIALVSRDGTPQLGVVYDPVEHTLYHATQGGGAFRNSMPWNLGEHGSRRQVFTDRSVARQPYFDNAVKALHIEQVSAEGGAVMNAMWVLENAPACYFKIPKPGPGGGSLWDFAATACLFREAGAVASDIHGNALDLNRPDSAYMNHRGILYATDPKLAQRIMEWYASTGVETPR